MRFGQATFVAMLVIALAACAHYTNNARLSESRENYGYRFDNLSKEGNTDSLFVILTFSGGGTRAAAFSLGVLEKLAATEIEWEGKKNLLDEVDAISSVSGGSFTAAYYALFGDTPGWREDFSTRFLKKDIQAELFWQLWNPRNWVRLASPDFSRIDMAAEYYSDHVFQGRTYNDLVSKGKRPYVLVNATDMSLGAQFSFTQDAFDVICSDLGKFPIGRAVAASSAYPVLLSPVTVNNYAGDCGFHTPGWVDLVLKERAVTASRFVVASNLQSYENAKERPFLHLIDGGIADNIGLRGPLFAITTTYSPWSLLARMDNGEILKLVVIVVDAGTNPKTDIDRKSTAPGWVQVLETTATKPMDNYSMDTVQLIEDFMREFNQAAQARKACEEVMKEKCPGAGLPGKFPEVEFYPVVLTFENIRDEQTRSVFLNMPTNFNLPSSDVDRLRNMAGQLLDESETFQKLLQDLGQGK